MIKAKDFWQTILYEINPSPANILRLIQNGYSMAVQHSVAYGLPARVHVESTNICHFDCSMCIRKEIDRPLGHMPLSVFEHAINTTKPVFLTLTGYGETLLNPEIYAMIRFATDQGICCKLDTNGIDNFNPEKLVESRLDLISFSLDAATEATYKTIRPEGNFQQILDNIGSLLEARKNKKKPKVQISMVLQQNNLSEMASFIALGHEHKVDFIRLASLNRYDKPDKYISHSIQSNQDKTQEHFHQAIQTARQFNDSLSENQLLDAYHLQKTGLLDDLSQLPCHFPWYSTMISQAGDVYPCCNFYNGDVVMGNIFEEDFSRIWNNTKYQRFRFDLKNQRGKYAICKNCNWPDWKFRPKKGRHPHSYRG